MAQEKAKVVHGPGPRGVGGPRPKVENPGKLLKRIMGEVFRHYLPHCIIVLFCIVASAMANVQAPTGDPEYWFTVFATSDATKNQGAYKNEKLDQLEEQLSQEFDTDKRAKLAVEMQQTVLDDNAFVYCSFLKMSQISRANVTGYMAHACDYYQVTADLDIN